MGDVTWEPVPTTEGNRRPAAGASSPEQDDEGYGRSAVGERGDRPACGRPQHAARAVSPSGTNADRAVGQAPARAGRGETVHRAAGSSAWRQGALHKTDGGTGPCPFPIDRLPRLPARQCRWLLGFAAPAALPAWSVHRHVHTCQAPHGLPSVRTCPVPRHICMTHDLQPYKLQVQG